MLVKILIVALLLYVVLSLFRALFAMLRQGEQGQMTRFLGRRLLISILVLGLVVVLIATGVIQPHSTPH
ncbi:DUF2909 domain-containing protein [Gallaecimonas xiamenensis]|uniref:DUF2909 domain-containing protein n=1 Tax=Gallaecimonas xiamenensis 3-C-1 TaxID=745411 RepID=K2JQA1_9GAMM|nr:DUF2909 domain-containing protein [Gallaecimonas xiamenensis]EKE77493.1 hypothetical protein B3C1_01740 [Gallaecimonas xiamenensis 3-C-1]